jgi:hypothetical protein
MSSRPARYLNGVACAAIAVLISGTALAAESCAEKNRRGKCVESDLASSMRQRAIEMSQPKISETAQPVAPSADRSAPRANDLNRYELNKGNFSTNPGTSTH